MNPLQSPIHDLAIIGDRRTLALVSRQGGSCQRGLVGAAVDYRTAVSNDQGSSSASAVRVSCARLTNLRL